MFTVEKVNYLGLKNCIRVSNGTVEFIATTQIGPRIIRYGFINGSNEFAEITDHFSSTDNDEWKLYGGHRLWHSPEADRRTYVPDNHPIKYELLKNGVILKQETESLTGIRKTMTATMEDSGKVIIKHELTNEGVWPVKLAVWSLSVTDKGGTEIMPMPDKFLEYLPNRSISLWPYAKMNDPRISWGNKYMILRQDCNCEGPFKLGYPNEHGWAAQFNHGNLFVVKYFHDDTREYPDFNSSYETYTNDFMTEMETLGPLVELQPGETTPHTETWELFKDITCPETEEDIDKIVIRYIK